MLERAKLAAMAAATANADAENAGSYCQEVEQVHSFPVTSLVLTMALVARHPERFQACTHAFATWYGQVDESYAATPANGLTLRFRVAAAAQFPKVQHILM